MAEQNTKIDVSLQEIYRILCPKCRKKLEEIISKKVTKVMVAPLLGEQEAKKR